MSASSAADRARAETVAARIDRVVRAIAGRWLAIFNLLIALYLALSFAAPVLMHNGQTRAARLIYWFFGTQCHQIAERSFFLYGEQLTYSVAELSDAAIPPGAGLAERGAYLGDEQQGWKVAFCQRDVATWGAILLGGLLFGLTGRRWKPLPLWAYGLSLLPLAVDGLTQLFGLRESNWLLRTLTGALFGLATVWLAYPYVQRGMSDALGQPGRTVRASSPVDLADGAK